MIRGKEVGLSLTSFAVGASIAAGAYFTEGYWQSMLLDLAIAFVALGAGLMVINFYLDMRARKSALEPMLELVEESIQQHHNDLMDRAWASIGKPQFSDLVDRYVERGRDPLALTPSERDAIYEMVKSDRDNLHRLQDHLDEQLKELTLILGWSFDPRILQHAFSCRSAIARMRTLDFDDTDATKREVCQMFLDIDISAFGLHGHLAEAIGLKAREVYYE
jgi:hypothetical protein